MTQRSLLLGLMLLVACALAMADGLSIELNKLEPQGGACRAYLVFDNSEGPALENLQMDLILFDQAGVIARRLAVDTGPLRAAKTSVKLFDIADLPCNDIRRILVNEVLDCRDAAGLKDDCIERLTLSSRADAQLVK